MTSADPRSLPVQVSPPQFALSEAPPHAIAGVEVAAIPVLPSDDDQDAPLLGPGAAALADDAGLDLVALAEAARATGRVGEICWIPVAEGTTSNPGLRAIALVGVGRQRPDDLRRAAAALARECRGRGSLATTLADAGPRAVEAVVVGLMLGSFSFSLRSTPDPTSTPVERVVLAGQPPAEDRRRDVDRAVALGGASWLARTLATVPSNIKSPAWLAGQAESLAAEAGLGVEIWDEKRLADEGFGGILGVGGASATPPRLIRLDYSPPRSNRKTPTVVLVGKGITFDSGGLNIKPGQGMLTMKRDMTGGAVVLATMAALAAVRCPVKVVGLVPTAENAVSGSAMRPGDVLRQYGGHTTEVTNTDAEGRLVLADGLAYAVANLDPAVLVDVATLTGAIKVALGQQVGGLFATDDALADHLLTASTDSGEPLWRFPLHAGYADALSSTVADADHAPTGGPGAITAALFLQAFTGGLPWAHLDIASVGDAAVDAFEYTAGPTGFGARALLTWLGSDDPLAAIR